ncbi:hypothetical protein ACFX2J_040970 [Malus domestica]
MHVPFCFPRVDSLSCFALYTYTFLLACCSGLKLAFHRCIMDVESPKCLTAVDGSFTTKDRLRRGKPPHFLGSQSKAFKGEEPCLDLVPPISPIHISWCCIKSGLFPVMLIHFEFSCGAAIGWANWVDTELMFAN